MLVESDAVVIGSGSTGIASALTLAEGGARVCILEKMKTLGGVSNFAEGMFAAESSLQKREYIVYSLDQAFKNFMEYSHWRANARLVRAFLNETPKIIDWLIAYGIEFEGVSTNSPGGPRVWHLLKGPERARGSALIKTLASKAKERGVQFYLSMPAKRLLLEGGRIKGVIAGEEEDVMFLAKVVIIATGGYANNEDWIKKYAGFELGVDITPVGNVGKMGDGIRMAWEVGADQEGMGVLQLLRSGPQIGSTTEELIGPLESAAYQPSLHVNQDGERYCDEGITGNFPFDGNAIARQKGRSVFTLLDDGFINYVMEHGIFIGTGRIIPPGSKIDIKSAIEEALKRGEKGVYGANSIEELAEKMRIDKERLKKTVEEYNECCRKGYDSLFAKDRKYLIPLLGPRFYALKCKLIFLGTLGGIKVNHRMEVLDKKGNPIPGLYAGGMDAGGLYGDSYDVITCGGTFAFGLASGRIAGRSALEYLRNL